MAEITLVVEGAAFDSQSVVDWNGFALATTFVATTTLTATIPTSDLASPGNDSITVINPTPCGGTETGFPDPGRARRRPSRLAAWLAGELAVAGSCKVI